MIALDTNILVGVFVDDVTNPDQIALARNFLADSKTVYVNQVVQVELVWVLESAFEFAKPEIIQVLDSLNQHKKYVLEHPRQFDSALNNYKQSNADFSDYIIFANAQSNQHEFWTFDKKLAKLNQVNRLV